MVAEVMPEQTEQTKQPVFKVERGKLAQALEWCLRAVCKDTQRPILCGVHFDCEMQSIVSTDMHRAHVATGFCLPYSFTLATDSAKDLLKELKKAVATVVHFHTEGCDLVSGQWRGKLIEGDFPRVDRVTPTEDEREASVQFIATDDLCAVLKYAGQCPSSRKNFQLPVNFQVGGKKVSVWHDVNETQVAFMHSEAECNTEGDTVTIFCRPSYLRDALLHLNRRSTFTSPQIDFWADLSPFVIRHNDRELYAVIMPCQRAVERSR
jgi:DNA polymerase III sliding clamp (beta) subunit (PCNA family)